MYRRANADRTPAQHKPSGFAAKPSFASLRQRSSTACTAAVKPSPSPAFRLGFLLPPIREDFSMNPITQESLELLKGALAKPNDVLAKSISTATGLLAYDLQAPAKNLYPFVTPIRNVIPRIGGGTGVAQTIDSISQVFLLQDR